MDDHLDRPTWLEVVGTVPLCMYVLYTPPYMRTYIKQAGNRDLPKGQYPLLMFMILLRDKMQLDTDGGGSTCTPCQSCPGMPVTSDRVDVDVLVRRWDGKKNKNWGSQGKSA